MIFKQLQAHLDLIVERDEVLRCLRKPLVGFCKCFQINVCALRIIFKAFCVKMILLAHLYKTSNQTASATQSVVV